MAKRRRPPSQSWKTFLRYHAEGIAALYLFVVPTVDLRMLFALVIIGIDRRLIVTINVTAHPPLPNGLLGRSPRRFHGIGRRNT